MKVLLTCSEYCTVELEPGYLVDVKRLESGLAYVMQNHDGTTVYSEGDRDTTFPGYEYDEAAVIKLAKEKGHP